MSVYLLPGSMQTSSSSSSGVLVDVTPPIIKNIHHVDMSWSEDQPSEYQGQNHSIGVYFEVSDPESEV